ncbi:SIMPL domain-containing protein [Tessaracoccus rhinocerotis]|uniref:SIMPL domain-containing protein n=1 Tax=Tessaracoccus rhinocerotis TaxID=1689449 RepID=A0A553K0P4_9ACTN|nr:SIMPL domain-containing protein [Tessaracoccus rhinocerotis]TRY18272.1 SIMPL domain-containing protein [Tessaracoccus rhinocerotis]
MKITVVGEAKASFQPELAVVHLSLGHESGDLDRAVEKASELADAMNTEFQNLRAKDPCPVTETVLLALSTRSWRPYAQDGSQLPYRHRASSRAKLTFNNFRELSAFIDTWGREDGVSVERVRWKLTDEREEAEKSRVLADAVANARDRAEVLAEAAGAGAVTFVELSDAPFPDSGESQPMAFAAGAMARGAAGGGRGEGVDLTPEDIEVHSTVHARFTTA